MSEQHTPEPWATSVETSSEGWLNQIINSTCEIVSSQSLSEADARRIVACVNWCAGNSTEGMARAVEIGRPYAVERDDAIERELELTKQRDELLAALKTIIKDNSHNPSLMVMIAKEAIASVEGERKLTIDNAPVGTQAPAINGGRWYRTERGWKWNGPDGTGSTFPGPGADWNGQLIAPDSVKGGA